MLAEAEVVVGEKRHQAEPERGGEVVGRRRESRQEPDQVREQDEGEHRREQRDELAAVVADHAFDHVVDERRDHLEELAGAGSAVRDQWFFGGGELTPRGRCDDDQQNRHHRRRH